MTLRNDAIAAYDARVANQVQAARTALEGVLAPYDVAALTHLEMAQLDANTVMAVFTDGDLTVAVTRRGGDTEAALIKSTDGVWQFLARIKNLADLGDAILKHLPEAAQ